MDNGIRGIEVRDGDEGRPREVRVVFGPHYFVEIHADVSGTSFVLGATHHGFAADASEVGGDLERVIEEIRRAHPDKAVD